MNKNYSSYSSLEKYNSRCNPGYSYDPDNKMSDYRGCIKDSNVIEKIEFIERVKENFNSCSAGYHYDPSNKLSDKKGCLKDVDTRCNIANLNINHNYGNDSFGALSLMGALKDPTRYDDNFYYQGVS